MKIRFPTLVLLAVLMPSTQGQHSYEVVGSDKNLPGDCAAELGECGDGNTGFAAVPDCSATCYSTSNCAGFVVHPWGGMMKASIPSECMVSSSGFTIYEKVGQASTKGDPHFKTWKQEHFEYHGQCDMVLTKDPSFADDLGIDVHIRTKIVRFWSYVQNAAIRIGNDILEVKGGLADDMSSNKNEVGNYWINFEFQGELTDLGGFPVSIETQARKSLGGTSYKRSFVVDLDAKYPGQKIIVSVFQEFVSVDFHNGSGVSFGNTVGLLGDFKTGKTLARDGSTVLHDFSELGNEWQVLPAEPKLFHEMARPQFPEKCQEPEDPRGDRRRRLDESNITEEQAEAACAKLTDTGDRKDCVYDVLATQNLNMPGAF